jgi:hypothetical protein
VPDFGGKNSIWSADASVARGRSVPANEEKLRRTSFAGALQKAQSLTSNAAYAPSVPDFGGKNSSGVRTQAEREAALFLPIKKSSVALRLPEHSRKLNP